MVFRIFERVFRGFPRQFLAKLVSWIFHLPFEQGIPCLLKASNKTTETILARGQIQILQKGT